MWKLEDAVNHYRRQGAPTDQAALVSLLREIQEEHSGRIPLYILAEAADALAVRQSFLMALIRRYPTLRLGEGHCLELCAGPNCSKHAALRAAAEAVCRRNPDKITLKYGPCMRLCGKGPNLKWDGTLYHQADGQLLKKLTENL